MFFSVRDLELREAGFDVSFEPGVIDFLDAKLRQAGPLVAKGTLEFVSHSEGDIQMHGTMKARMEADCDRCLEPAPFEVESDLDILFKPAQEAESDEEAELGEDDAEIAFYSGDGIQLEDILREQVVLAQPYKLVCKEDCQGLCPVCGENWNLRECACERKLPDARWSALKEL